MMFSFNLSSTILGGNVRSVGIKVSNISCNHIEVLGVLLEENDNFLYQRRSVNDGEEDWCKAMCEKGFSGKSKLSIKMSNFGSLETTSEICEIVFL